MTSTKLQNNATKQMVNTSKNIRKIEQLKFCSWNTDIFIGMKCQSGGC